MAIGTVRSLGWLRYSYFMYESRDDYEWDSLDFSDNGWSSDYEAEDAIYAQRGKLPYEFIDRGKVGHGVMDASYVTYRGERYVAKLLPEFKLRREMFAYEAARKLGMSIPELVIVREWLLSREIPQVSHEVARHAHDDDFLLWAAEVAAFDSVIGNYDRHDWNVLLTPSGNYIIDHERIRPGDGVARTRRTLRGGGNTLFQYYHPEKHTLVRSLAADVLLGWIHNGKLAEALGSDFVEALA